MSLCWRSWVCFQSTWKCAPWIWKFKSYFRKVFLSYELWNMCSGLVLPQSLEWSGYVVSFSWLLQASFSLKCILFLWDNCSLIFFYLSLYFSYFPYYISHSVYSCLRTFPFVLYFRVFLWKSFPVLWQFSFHIFLLPNRIISKLI